MTIIRMLSLVIQVACVCLALFIAMPIQAHAEAQANYHYSGDFEFDPTTGFIKLNWQISFLDHSQQNVSFILRSTLNNIKVSGEQLKSKSIRVEDPKNQLQRIELCLNPGKSNTPRVINLSYEGILLPKPMDNLINQVSKEAVELNVDSFWLPMDARFNQLLTTNLNIKANKQWLAVGAGTLAKTANGYQLTNMTPSLDIAFALSSQYKVSRFNGYALYDLRENERGIDQLNDAISFCFNYLNGKFGDKDPLTKVTFTINNRPSSGYARSNYIALTEIADTPPERLTQFVCHEIAHHWSNKGKFDTEENWLNEAFAEYIGMMALRTRFGVDAFEKRLSQFKEQIGDKQLGPIWTPELTERPAYLVSYRKAPIVLNQLEQKIGEDQFAKFITLYMTMNTSSTEQLLDHLAKNTNKLNQQWFVNLLAM